MKRNEIIKALEQLGKIFRALGQSEEWSGSQLGVTKDEYLQLQTLINRQLVLNGWFTKENVKQALLAHGENLTEERLTNWSSEYSFSEKSKKVAIIMAGNIPLVGFHDFLCVLLSGNSAVCKLSSDDKTLLPAFVQILYHFNPEFQSRIILTENRIGEVDAVLATGSDNSMKFFEEYFGKYPHIFRRNRTSLAILDGSESKEDMFELGNDIFNYFGLGCRNVSHLLVPKGYDFKTFFEGIVDHNEVINHFKYGNNYDYNRTVYLMNLHEMLDNNFVLLYQNEELFSPLAMIYYHTYESQADIDAYLESHKDQIQAVVGSKHIAFGDAQRPELSDYADGVDVMKWLETISK